MNKSSFTKEIVPGLQKKLGTKNVNAVPKVTAIHVNVGIGSYVSSGKDHEDVVTNIALITGQKPIVQLARKAISNFKLKQNMPCGVTVTLRGKRMYDFLTKLVNVVFPRIRDFRGISRKAFDNRGNYSIGLREHIVFPEIEAEDVNKIHGVQVTIKTSAKDPATALTLLEAMGFPFKKATAPLHAGKKPV